jgi:predicted dehydrogenase/threonine dehydrogenase-like Zn-dependent dehydrogenase
MKQVFSSKHGISVQEVPEILVKKGFVKIKVLYSCISAGTEIATVKGSSKSLFQRVIDDPKKITQIIDIAKNQGLSRAKNKVDSTAEKLTSLGYSVSGQITEVGEGVTNFMVDDFVSAGGGGFALHAEMVVVPVNLVVKVPVGLDIDLASMGTIGAIALHGVRRANLHLGEFGVVFGTGLIGLLTLLMLKSSGVKVACVDINSNRLSLAKELGADKIVNPTEEDAILGIQNWTSGFGADAVLFTASTQHDEPLSQAFNMCRKKGKVILVGVAGMNIKRGDIYKNEIDILISTSYGPGRYDDNYELEVNDYPYAYVRWTENRNIAAFLDFINGHQKELLKLNPKKFLVEDAAHAYKEVQNDSEHHILTFLDYTKLCNKSDTNLPIPIAKPIKQYKDRICIGLIGAGSFATNTLLPIIHDYEDLFYIKTIVNNSGDKAVNVAKQFKVGNVSSNINDILNDPEIDLVMICTRHNNHAELVLKALQHNKNVFVEKPLATTIDELQSIEDFYKEVKDKQSPLLMVGFNRRYSIYAREIKASLDKRNSPAILRYRLNAGFVAYDNWIHQSGGRIVGEACHIIDLMQYLTGSEISDCTVNEIQPLAGQFKASDNRSISLTFMDGSIAMIDYFSCGNNNIPKEYLEVHFENKSIIMEDYKLLTGFGIKLKNYKSAISQKGHKEEWLAVFKAMKDGAEFISLESLFQTTRISILASK